MKNLYSNTPHLLSLDHIYNNIVAYKRHVSECWLHVLDHTQKMPFLGLFPGTNFKHVSYSDYLGVSSRRGLETALLSM